MSAGACMSGVAAPDPIATHTRPATTGLARRERIAEHPDTCRPRRQTPFMQLRVGAVADFCDQHGVSFLARSVLREVVELVWPIWFHDTGSTTLRCSQTGLAEYLGFAGGHGRRQLGDALRELQAAGAVTCIWHPGRDGSVTVNIFQELVHSPTPTERSPLHLVDPTSRAGRRAPPRPRADGHDLDRRRADDQHRRRLPEEETIKTPTQTPPIPRPALPPDPGGGGGREIRGHQQTVTAAISELVARERALNVTEIRNPGGWERTVRDRLMTEHGERMLELAIAEPELSAADLADRTVPPPQPATTAARKPETRPHDARCPECDDQHIVEVPPDPINVYGTVAPCPLCRPRQPQTTTTAPHDPTSPSEHRRHPAHGETTPQPIRPLLETALTPREDNV